MERGKRTNRKHIKLFEEARDLAEAGRLDEAENGYRKLLRVHPRSILVLGSLFSLLLERSDLAFEADDLCGADELMDKAQAVAERLVSLDPDNSDHRRNMAVCCARYAGIRGARGDHAEELALHRKAMGMFESIGLQSDVSISLQIIAKIERKRGDRVAARASLKSAIALAKKMAKLQPADLQWRFDILNALMRLGNMDAKEGEFGSALRHHKRMLEAARELAAFDPDSIVSRRHLSVAMELVGESEWDLGRTEIALEYYREGHTIAEELVACEPDVLMWQRDLALSHARIGRALLGLGRMKEARASLEDSREITKQLAALGDDVERDLVTLAQDFEDLGIF